MNRDNALLLANSRASTKRAAHGDLSRRPRTHYNHRRRCRLRRWLAV